MKEKSIVDAILRKFKAMGIYVVKMHGGPMGLAGLPDVWAVTYGRLICLEVKRPKSEGGKNPTKRQLYQMRQLLKAGAVVEVVRSVDEAVEIVELVEREMRKVRLYIPRGRFETGEGGR